MAKLCFVLGVGCNVDWYLEQTATTMSNDLKCARDYFRYDGDILLEEADESTDAKFIEECRWFRPVKIAGYGHTCVLHGYNTGAEPVQFLINEGGTEHCSKWFTRDQTQYDTRHITRIAPRDYARFVGGGVPGDGSPSSPHANVEEALASAPDHATLVLKAVSDNTFAAASLVISRPLVLRGYQAVIRKD